MLDAPDKGLPHLFPETGTAPTATALVRAFFMPRILLVEDDPDVRLLVEHVLLDAGYAVDTTDSVEGGQSLLECRRYDLVLADGRLPDGTGMMVADRAQELGDTPALIVTGYAFDLPRDHLVRYDYLLKPVRPSELVTAVRRVLGEPSPLDGPPPDRTLDDWPDATRAGTRPAR